METSESTGCEARAHARSMKGEIRGKGGENSSSSREKCPDRRRWSKDR